MKIDIQLAPVSKRMFAFLLDLILASILVTGFYLVLSSALDIDSYGEKYNERKAAYETVYGVDFENDDYQSMDETAKANYKAAVDAMNADEEANKAIKTSYALTFGILGGGIVLAMLLLEFVVPLLLKDGRTLGKRLFGLGVMRRSSLRISAPVLFVRGVIGKGLFELVLPVMLIVTAGAGVTGIFGLILLGIMVIAEIVVVAKSGTNAFLHDLLSDSVVIDWDSQQIFPDEGSLRKYLAERAEAESEAGPESAGYEAFDIQKTE